MSTSKHIYNYGSEYQRVVILNHGGSETTVLYDSDETEKPPLRRRQRNSWYKHKKEQEQKQKSKLSIELQRARDNGDL